MMYIYSVSIEKKLNSQSKTVSCIFLKKTFLHMLVFILEKLPNFYPTIAFMRLG